MPENLKKWFIFPDILPTRKFLGFESRPDETQTRGSFIVGQNVKFTDAETPTVRDGYEPVGTEAADATPVRKAWLFERRDGVQIEFKTYDTKIDFWIRGVSTAWKLFKSGFTADKDFGIASIGQSDQTAGWFFFCNGTENPFRATATHVLISSSTATTITKTGTTTWSAEGFSATGTVIINGTEYTYTGGTGTTTITGVAGDPTGEAVNSIVIQSPVELTGVIGGGTDPVKFAVAMAHDGRLHYRREARQSVWDYSKLDNPDDVATGASDGQGGAKEIEFSGPITAFGKLNKTILCLKSRLITLLDFIQVGSRLDSPRYQTLVSADDKSTTLGATNQKSTFSSPLGMIFITPDKRCVALTGITQNNEPQYLILSDPVQTVFDQGVFDNAAGVCFNNRVYLSFKENKDSIANDTVMVGDLLGQSLDRQGKPLPVRWDTPYIGWNVGDWTIVYNSTDKKQELHWHSSLNSNTYRIIDQKTDNTVSFTTTLRSHSEIFDAPYLQKRIDSVLIEIKMLENTELTATLLFDINGYTGQKEYTLLGTRSGSLLQGATYNPFGASSFGSQKIGSNPQQEELKRYIFELEVNPNTRFFSLALQLSGTDENADYELIRWGARVVEYVFETDLRYKLAPS